MAGPDAPKTPVIDTIAYHGIRFRNTWSMPECSPARAAFFTGRWPLRNNIFQAIGSHDLNNSQVANLGDDSAAAVGHGKL